MASFGASVDTLTQLNTALQQQAQVTINRQRASKDQASKPLPNSTAIDAVPQRDPLATEEVNVDNLVRASFVESMRLEDGKKGGSDSFTQEEEDELDAGARKLNEALADQRKTKVSCVVLLFAFYL